MQSEHHVEFLNVKTGGKIHTEFGISRKIVRLVNLSLTETHSRDRVGKNMSDRFPIRNGLKQGDALLPMLLTLL